MKLTNKLGLPQPLVDAVRNDGYDRGDSDISVTGLITPPRQATLRERHEDEITEDASDRIWSLVGQVVHGVLERAERTALSEHRLYMECEGWRISGQMDRVLIESAHLQDYKFVTAYKFKNGVAPQEFVEQMNLYAVLLRKNGIEIKTAEIIGILRDWSKPEAARDPAYPQTQVVRVPVELWEPEKAERFMRERVILHKQARVELPLCSAEDRWAKPDTFAVMKQGAARATRVYENEDEAIAHAKQTNGLYVQKRQGENTRCKLYCNVSRFCDQYKALEASNRSEWESKPLAVGQSKAG